MLEVTRIARLRELHSAPMDIKFMENIITTYNLFFPILGIVGILIGIIWSANCKRIAKVEEKLKKMCVVYSDIAEIKNDLKWIKQILSNKK